MQRQFVLIATLVSVLATACATSASAPTPAPRAPAAAAAEFDAVLFPSPQWVKITADSLEKSYDAIYAISDIHGTLESLTPLLQSAGLITEGSTDDRYTWTGGKSAGKRHLLVVVGDSINKGPDSVRVLLRLKEIQTQAKTKGGRVIVLLGNHEAEFLADPKSCSKEMLKSARDVDGIQKGDTLSCKDIGKSAVGEFMASMPVGAVIGSWLFVHGGYLGVKTWPKTAAEKQAKLKRYFAGINKAYADEDYATLDDDASSILATHKWWKKFYAESREAVLALGLSGLVVGHEPDSLDAKGTIAASRSGWFIKLDAGMNPEADDSKGRVLKCKVSTLLQADGRFRLTNKVGDAVCTQFGPKKEQDLEIKSEQDDGSPVEH
jgi:hypothetical protein